MPICNQCNKKGCKHCNTVLCTRCLQPEVHNCSRLDKCILIKKNVLVDTLKVDKPKPYGLIVE